VELPAELQAVFRRHPDAKAKFEAFGEKHQRQYVTYVAEAKKPETRLNRADRVVMMLTGKKLATVYKPKTIPEVFGLKPDHRVRIVNPPPDYDKIMDGYVFQHPVKTDKSRIDVAHVFVNHQAELESWLPRLRQQLVDNGMIWVSWPKMSSGTKTDVNETSIRRFAADIDLVDVKVCAVSDYWSGLKLVIPIARRGDQKKRP
jgi:hypothetical protein